MAAPALLDEPEDITSPSADDGGDGLIDRVRRLETDLAEVRHTISELADIVVGDIKERRAVPPSTDTYVVPPSVIPGGQVTMTAVAGVLRPWLLIDLLKEVGLASRMYFDPRYRVRRSTQLMVPILLGLFAANYLLFNSLLSVMIVSPILERLAGIVLAVLLYKVVAREVSRYRAAVAHFLATSIGVAPTAILLSGDPESAAHARQEVE